MNKADVVLIITMFLFAALLIFVFEILQSNATSDGVATVYYNDQTVLSIDLSDGSHTVFDASSVIDVTGPVYTVSGTNGDVVIEYKEGAVRVIDEISPQNICQLQGWSDSPFMPLTCLPNNVVIIITESFNDQTPDGITG